MTFNDFIIDRKTIDAVVRNFEIIGEASKYIPDDVKDKHPDIDWRGVLGSRNRIAHEYFDVDASIIWNIAKNEPRTRERYSSQSHLGYVSPLCRRTLRAFHLRSGCRRMRS